MIIFWIAYIIVRPRQPVATPKPKDTLSDVATQKNYLVRSTSARLWFKLRLLSAQPTIEIACDVDLHYFKITTSRLWISWLHWLFTVVGCCEHNQHKLSCWANNCQFILLVKWNFSNIYRHTHTQIRRHREINYT